MATYKFNKCQCNKLVLFKLKIVFNITEPTYIDLYQQYEFLWAKSVEIALYGNNLLRVNIFIIHGNIFRL